MRPVQLNVLIPTKAAKVWSLSRDLLLAVLIGGLAVILRAVAQPVLGDTSPFLFAFPATVLAALVWGALPGLVTASVCAIFVAAPDIPQDIAEPKKAVQLGGFLLAALLISGLCGYWRKSRTFEAIARRQDVAETPLGSWLKAVLWGVLLVPMLAFLAASWWSLDKAETASNASLAHASELAFRQVQRTFAAAEEIADRADQASLGSDQEVGSREAEIHLRLSDMAAGVTSVVNANVWSASGASLARSDAYPVDPRSSISDRAYFQAQQRSTGGFDVSELVIGRVTGKELINVVRRRTSPDGSFRGVVTVSLAPAFFRSYWESLSSEEPTLQNFTLVRSDGKVLATWPAEPKRSVAEDPKVLDSLHRGMASARIELPSSGGFDAQSVNVVKVPNAPIYVLTAVSRTVMLKTWGRFVGLLAALLGPTTAGLVYVTWVALRKTRQEAAMSMELQAQIRARAATELKMLESQKFESLAFVTAGVAHDFNNLMAVISASLHVHRRRHPQASTDRSLDSISKAVQSGVRLTRQLLSFSQKQALRPEIVHFQTWLPATDDLLLSAAGSTLSWTARVEPDCRPVMVDVGELELALINVVVNAKHAMPEGGALDVHVSNDEHASADAPSVIVCIKDTGEGIAEDILPRVFEPLFTTRKKGVGSGLGLSQVHGFCTQAGGRATIASKVGEGTVVCLHLPAVADTSEPVVLPGVPTGRVLNARLLLVEDHEDVGRTTEQMLSSSGLHVKRVVNADEALAYLMSTDTLPDIVLSDISMPGTLNGIDLALELARSHPGLPVVLTTGYAEQILNGSAQGLSVLQKPVAPDDLLATLAAALARPHRGG